MHGQMRDKNYSRVFCVFLLLILTEDIFLLLSDIVEGREEGRERQTETDRDRETLM